jgi:hypothetical protein
MNRNPKRLMWVFTVATTVAVVVGFVLYSRGMLPIHPFWWQRPVMAPSSEDYDAYSGFVNDFFSPSQRFSAVQSISPDSIVLIAAETLTMRNTSDPILPLEVAALGPEDMGQDFFRQNAKTWHLEARFHTRVKVFVGDKQMLRRGTTSGIEELFAPPKKDDAARRLPPASPARPFPENPKVSGVLRLSRIGFDHSRTRGIVYYDYSCGSLCGQAGWATLRKVHREWVLEEMGPGLVY